ncbi:hypothetical protein ACVWXS_004126 [Lysinibacillus sp. TE18511]
MIKNDTLATVGQSIFGRENRLTVCSLISSCTFTMRVKTKNLLRESVHFYLFS